MNVCVFFPRWTEERKQKEKNMYWIHFIYLFGWLLGCFAYFFFWKFLMSRICRLNKYKFKLFNFNYYSIIFRICSIVIPFAYSMLLIGERTKANSATQQTRTSSRFVFGNAMCGNLCDSMSAGVQGQPKTDNINIYYGAHVREKETAHKRAPTNIVYTIRC